MKQGTLDKLYEPFEEIAQKPGSGQYKYVKSNHIIDRMNKTFEGDWSSEVIGREIIEDNILIHVRVHIKDNGHSFFHDGYGSVPIARFSFGDKKGEVISIGNNYNAAKSLAIKDACKKWGVALYLEPDEEGTSGEDKPKDTGTPGPRPGPLGPTPKSEPMPDVKRAVPDVNHPGIPTMPTRSVPNITETNSPVIPDVPTRESTPKESVTKPIESDNITDVQRVAIQGLLELKGLKFSDLVKDALNREDNLPLTPNDLSYQEAVKVIKFGNDVDK